MYGSLQFCIKYYSSVSETPRTVSQGAKVPSQWTCQGRHPSVRRGLAILVVVAAVIGIAPVLGRTADAAAPGWETSVRGSVFDVPRVVPSTWA